MTAEKRARTEAETEITPAVFLKQTWTDIQASADELFTIKRPHDMNRNNPASWHLVQVDADETNCQQAKTVGEHHVKCHTRNFTDAKKKLVRHNCRHWPLIREIKQPSGKFGDIVVLGPSEVEETLAKKPCTQGWHQGTVNLAEQGLVGPFNFSINPPGQFLIDQATWTALEATDEAEAGRVTSPTSTESHHCDKNKQRNCPETTAQLHECMNARLHQMNTRTRRCTNAQARTQ
jgi:hypothetical protein